MLYTELMNSEKTQQSYIPENLGEWVDRHGNGKITSEAKQPEYRCYQLVLFTSCTLTQKEIQQLC